MLISREVERKLSPFPKSQTAKHIAHQITSPQPQNQSTIQQEGEPHHKFHSHLSVHLTEPKEEEGEEGEQRKELVDKLVAVVELRKTLELDLVLVEQQQ